jgi:hypothetical protein
MKEIIVDDHFLCYKPGCNSSGKPVFAKGVNDELWAMVLEKVLAKKYGSYAQIEAGQPSMALHDLTGAPGFYKKNSSLDKDVLWNYIVRDLERKYVLVCTANTSDTDENIVANHAYSMLSTH